MNNPIQGSDARNPRSGGPWAPGFSARRVTDGAFGRLAAAEPVRRAPLLRVRRYQAIGALVCSLFLWGTSLVSRSSEFVPDRPAPYRLALTFDDGPHLYYTERLLAILREHGSAATFFVVGRKAEQYPGLVLAMGRDGHDVANHTFNHPNLTTLSARSIREELDRTQALLRKVSPASRPYFRPPGGRYNGKVARVAAENGYRMVLWNVFPQDHKRPSAQEIYDRVMAGAVDNGVVLLHSGIDSTLEALPRLIRDLKARGFQLVTVSQLLEQTPAQDQVAAWSPGAPAS